MQRVDGEGHAGGLGGLAHQLPQGGEVADALIAVAADRIELGRDAEAGVGEVGVEAGGGRHGDAADDVGRVVPPDAMPADRQRRQGARAVCERGAVAQRFALLGYDVEPERAGRVAFGDRNRQVQRLARAAHQRVGYGTRGGELCQR